MRRTLIALGALLLAGVASAAPAPVHEFELDNGLKLLVREDHRAPVVVSQVWYRVGSSHEPMGITGVSHLLEHLMFKATENLESGEFSRTIAANGGRENAFTSRDYTGYYQQLERSRLEVSFRLEAERMRGLRFDEESFAQELRVVQEERRLRTEDDAERLTMEHLQATAFLTSPYRQPVVGWMDDLESMRLDAVRAWYERWYAPNNATVVVVGDVEPKAVLALAERYFGPLPRRELEPVRVTAEIEQRGERRVVVRAPAELPMVALGYRVPTLVTATDPSEAYALEVLSGVLDGGDSARIQSALVRGQQLAASAGAGYGLVSRLDDLFVLSGNPAPGKTTEALEAALREEVRRLQETLVTREELDRVIAQVVASEVYQRDSVFYQAMRLGLLETVGLGWRALDDYVERVRAVTPEQIQAVARRYLTADRVTVAELHPLALTNGTGEGGNALR